MKLCIYHGNCADGFGAAYAVREALGADVEFFPGVYQNSPPDVAGRDVIMVDFSYKRAVIEEMATRAKSILILDHHKTAAEDLAGFQRVPDPPWDYVMGDRFGWLPDSGVYVLFDMNRSGAGLAWDHFHGVGTRPPLIDHIEDRDLWRFALPKTREIQAAVFSHPYDFKAWDALMATPIDALIREGTAIERKHHKDIDELVGVVTRKMKIGGAVVPMANLPYTLTSDAGHKLAEGYPFAGCYWDTPAGRVFSLRSRDDGADVAEIAKMYGGGGHLHASGFRMPFDQLGQFEP